MDCDTCEAVAKAREEVKRKAREYAKKNGLEEILIVKTRNGFYAYRRIDDETASNLPIMDRLYIGQRDTV